MINKKIQFLLKRIGANIIDFIIFVSVSVLVIYLITILQKNLQIYDKDGGFYLILRYFMHIVALLLVHFFVFGIIASKTKKTIGKVVAKIYVKPIVGRMTSARMFFREIILKQIFFLLIVMYLTHEFLQFIDVENLPNYLGNPEFFTNIAIKVVIIIFLILNILAFILVGYSLTDLILKTCVKKEQNKYINL